MGDKTAIEWTDATWNPTVGCSKVSAGCDHCYAIGVAHRAMQPAHAGLTLVRDGERPDWTGEVRTLTERLDQPLRWKKPRRIFVNSLSDLFHPDIDPGFVAQVFAVMAQATQHTFQVLTKRPKLMAELLGNGGQTLLEATTDETAAQHLYEAGWPLPNVWLGTSIDEDRYAFRADHLRNTPAAVRFLSLEPLLGALPSLDLTDIDWVIVGGESGPGARPMHPVWVTDLRDRCLRHPCEGCDGGRSRGRMAACPRGCGSVPLGGAGGPGVRPIPFMFKQWGSWGPYAPMVNGVYQWQGGYAMANDGTLYKQTDLAYPDGPRRGEAIRADHDRAQLTGMYRHRSKKDAGRDLDGRTWDEFPRGIRR